MQAHNDRSGRPVTRHQGPVAHFTGEQRWKWIAKRCYAVWNFLSGIDPRFKRVVVDPEGRGCCFIFSILGTIWPSLLSHGLESKTQVALETHEGSYRTRNNSVPCSDRVASAIIREEVYKVAKACMEKDFTLLKKAVTKAVLEGEEEASHRSPRPRAGARARRRTCCHRFRLQR